MANLIFPTGITDDGEGCGEGMLLEVQLAGSTQFLLRTGYTSVNKTYVCYVVLCVI